MKKHLISLICLLISLIMLIGCTSCTVSDNKNNNSGSPATPAPVPDNTDTSPSDKVEEDNRAPESDKTDSDKVEQDSTQKPSSVPILGGAVTKYYFSESGKFISDTGTNLNLYISWSASSTDGKNLKVVFSVGIESYSIQVGARPDLGKFKLNGETVSFSTDALTIADNRKKVSTEFASFEHVYEFQKGDTVSLDVAASWVFNGVYGGHEVGTIVSAGIITLHLPE
jgi:hypothetical protein